MLRCLVNVFFCFCFIFNCKFIYIYIYIYIYIKLKTVAYVVMSSHGLVYPDSHVASKLERQVELFSRGMVDLEAPK